MARHSFTEVKQNVYINTYQPQDVHIACNTMKCHVKYSISYGCLSLLLYATLTSPLLVDMIFFVPQYTCIHVHIYISPKRWQTIHF